MSRLAEAFRKAGGSAAPVGTLALPASTPPPVWELAAGGRRLSAVPLGTPALPVVAAPAHALEPAHSRALARIRPAAPREEISRDEAAALVRRLYGLGATAPSRRAVLFSAVGPTSACTRLAAAAAQALSGQTTASVCLVDANLRSPTLHELFGLPGHRGFSELLVADDDIRLGLARVAANLWLLPCGSRGAEARHNLSAERLRPRLQALLAMFDYLVVDTAAADAHRDAIVLGPLLDGVVVVVAANGTRRETARRTVAQLGEGGARVLGAVLAERTLPIPDIIYRRL